MDVIYYPWPDLSDGLAKLVEEPPGAPFTNSD